MMKLKCKKDYTKKGKKKFLIGKKSKDQLIFKKGSVYNISPQITDNQLRNDSLLAFTEDGFMALSFQCLPDFLNEYFVPSK